MKPSDLRETIEAPEKDYCAMTIDEDDLTSWYTITGALLSLALGTLGTEGRKKLARSDAIAADLARLDRSRLSDPETLADATARIFGCIAELTDRRAIVAMIREANEQLFHVRMLECRQLHGVKHELTSLCRLLLGDDREAMVAGIEAYHNRRLAIVPELIELSRG